MPKKCPEFNQQLRTRTRLANRGKIRVAGYLHTIGNRGRVSVSEE
jgi:hypothetical protein